MIMWSSRMFWKLFVSYALLNLAATLTFVVIVSGWQQAAVVKQFTRRLDASATLILDNILHSMSGDLSEELQSAVRQKGADINTRITIVTMEGMVIADSTRETLEEVAQMENHRNRPELLQAVSQGRGASERKSPTLGEPLLYVAIRAERDGEPIGIVRASLPMTDVFEEVAEIQRLIWLVAMAVSLAVLALTYFVAARVARPIGKLRQAAEAIAAGDYQYRVFLDSTDDLGDLANSFNRMSDQLAARVAQLRSSRQRLETVLEGMVEGVIALDERERIVLANAEAGRLLGFVPSEAEGRPLLEVVRNHVLHGVLSEAQAARESQRAEIELADEGNRVLNVYVTRLSGEPSTRFILVLQDVTDLRRLESLRHEFVANVSHELKTPLSSIKAYAETLLRGAINDAENNTKFLRGIEEQADRLHELILDMLRLARIESGQQAFDIGAVHLAEVVDACISEHQAAADVKSITLSTAGERPDLLLNADEEGLRQILNNLIDNALKYTPESGAVTVAWDGDDTMAVIQVRDTGIGIGAEHLPRVFERFYRADKARSRQLGGTGLGLSIVKHLTQSFGGGVEVESRPGEGTVFTIRLPCI